MKIRTLIISCIIALCVVAMILLRYSSPKIKAYAELSRDTALVADKVTYTIKVVADKEIQLDLPDASGALKKFNIFDEGLSKKDSLWKRCYTKWYVIIPYEPGEYFIQGLEVNYKNKNGSSGRIGLEKKRLFVKSVVGKEAEKDFVAKFGAGLASGAGGEGGTLSRIDTPIRLKIIDIDNVMGIITISDALFVAALFIGAILAIYLAFYFIKARMNRPRPLSAYETAIKNLTEIDTEKAYSADELKDLYYKISRIIRNYSKEVLSFGPGELTTKEFLAKLEGATALSDGIKNTVKELVVHCDLVKFSGSTASIEEFKSHFDGAKNIIEQINAAMTPKENDK